MSENEQNEQNKLLVKQPDFLSEDELNFCSFVEQIFRLTGNLPPYERCLNSLDFINSRQDYDRLWGSKRVQRYLKGIGIDVDKILSDSEVLTPIQLLTINTMLDYNDRRSDARKLKELGVTSKQWQIWRSDPAFASYLKARVEKIVGDDTDEIDRALFDRARSGDITAIKYINEYTGRYRPVTNSGYDFDPKLFLIRIQEIILRHVGDQEVLQSISRELEELALTVTSGYSGTSSYSPFQKVDAIYAINSNVEKSPNILP